MGSAEMLIGDVVKRVAGMSILLDHLAHRILLIEAILSNPGATSSQIQAAYDKAWKEMAEKVQAEQLAFEATHLGGVN